VPNRTWSWPSTRDGLLVIGVTVLALVLGALASDLLSSERPPRPVTGNRSSPRSKLVPGMTPEVGTAGCQCTDPAVPPKRALAHAVGQAIGTEVIPVNDGDRRRDLLVMAARIGRRHAATALTLQPYRLSLGPESLSAGVATSVADGLMSGASPHESANACGAG
jgi:hypothetical protein